MEGPGAKFDVTSVDNALVELLGGRWRIAILRSLLARSPQRLSELKRSVPGISKKVLLDNLRFLQDAGLLDRKDLSTKLKRVEYSLQESARQAVQNVFTAAEQLKRAPVTSTDRSS